MSGPPSSPEFSDLLTTGEEVVNRDVCSSVTVPMTSGIMRVTYFTAKKDEANTSAVVWSGTTPAGATPTLVRIGLWTANDVGALLVLVAATPNDTALLSVANTEYTKAFSGGAAARVRGQRYGFGVLVVTSFTAPQLSGAVFGAQSAIMGRSPMKCGSLSGLTDLPATGSPAAGLNRPYGVILP